MIKEVQILLIDNIIDKNVHYKKYYVDITFYTIILFLINYPSGGNAKTLK